MKCEKYYYLGLAIFTLYVFGVFSTEEKALFLSDLGKAQQDHVCSNKGGVVDYVRYHRVQCRNGARVTWSEAEVLSIYLESKK